jgi:ribonuclease-3
MKLDYVFQNQELLKQALTHSSYAYEHPGVTHNERLEFLGDSVVQLLVTEALVARYSAWSEGNLSKARARLVSEGSLSKLARKLELGNELLLGAGERVAGRSKDRLLADSFEAVFGAIYLDGGLEAARRVLLRILEEELEQVGSGPLLDVRSALQELAQRQGWGVPDYRIVHMEGPDHARQFHAEVVVQEQEFGPGIGSSKKAAYEAAAALALASLAPMS